jgi:uncharacterized membrane protein
MNIEELKLVLETIRSLTGDATSAAYWYFGLEFAKFVLGWLVGAGVVLTITRMIVTLSGSGRDEEFMRECRDELRIGSRGALDEAERAVTQRAIRKLIEESKQ